MRIKHLIILYTANYLGVFSQAVYKESIETVKKNLVTHHMLCLRLKGLRLKPYCT